MKEMISPGDSDVTENSDAKWTFWGLMMEKNLMK